MPEGTLKALADHGTVGPLLPADGGDAESVLAAFAKAGVDVDALAAQLQDEGAKSFVKSWHELMEVILSKSSEKMQGVIKKLAEEKGLDMVVDASTTLYFKDAMDITKDAIAAYDKAYPAK